MIHIEADEILQTTFPKNIFKQLAEVQYKFELKLMLKKPHAHCFERLSASHLKNFMKKVNHWLLSCTENMTT